MMSSHERVSSQAFDWRPVQEKGLILLGAHAPYSQNERDDLWRAVALLSRGTFKMDGIISHRFPLEHIQEAFETLEHKPVDYLKGVVTP